MTPDEYIKQAMKSRNRSFYTAPEEVLHAAMGCVTESGELMDAIKKSCFYGRSIDENNLKEEAGDILWYLSLLFNHYGWTYEEVMELNINKLRTRYPEQFTEEKALNRNLEAERNVLDGNICNKCAGSGIVEDLAADSETGKYTIKKFQCDTCNGSGKV